MDVSRALQMRAGFWQRCLHDLSDAPIRTAVSCGVWRLFSWAEAICECVTKQDCIHSDARRDDVTGARMME
jgi:hypothetical protein